MYDRGCQDVCGARGPTLLWALDRFSREGMVPMIQHLERLNSDRVTFHSYTEPHLCADHEMVQGILLAVLATMAKQEAKRLSERVIAGMRRAAAKGRCREERAIQRRGGSRANDRQAWGFKSWA